MKFLLFTFMVVTTVVYPSAQVRPSKRDLRQYVNSKGDEVLGRVRNYMQAHGMDPHPISDTFRPVVYNGYLIKYRGMLALTQGKVRGISQGKRDGDVFVTNHGSEVLVSLPIIYDEIDFKYHYVLNIMGLKPGGEVEGKIRGLTLHVLLQVDTRTFKLNLLEFGVERTGRISMSFSGHILWDWFINVVSGVINIFMKEEINNMFSTVVHEKVQAYVRNINEYITKHPKQTQQFVKNNFKGIIP